MARGAGGIGGAIGAYGLCGGLVEIVENFLLVLEEGDGGWPSVGPGVAAMAYGGPVVLVLCALLRLAAVRDPVVAALARVRTAGPEGAAPSTEAGEGGHRARS